MWEEFQYRLYSTSNQIPARTYAPGTFYQTDAVGDYATDFIRHSLTNDAPFFMYVAFGAPHFPIQAPLGLIDKYVPTYAPGWEVLRANRFERMKTLGLLTQPPWLLSPASDSPPWLTAGVEPIPVWSTMSADRQADSARKMAAYAAMMDSVDSNIGKIQSLLQQSNQLDNTIIFFVSDNGGDHEGGVYGSNGRGANTLPLTGSALLTLGQPGEPDTYLGAGWANVNNTPYTYYKRNCHEGGIATPLIVHWPEGITRPGQFERSPGHVIDLFPTLLDVTGFTYPTQFNGHAVIAPEPHSRSLAAHFTNSATVSRTLAGEHESNRSYREGNWKLVTKNFTDSRNVAHALELYKLASDPVELNDLSASFPGKVNEMATNWNAWAARVGVPSSRFITIMTPMPQFDPAPLPNDLFVDNFNRADSPDHDATAAGMSGALVPPLGATTAYFDSWEAGSTEIAGLGLRLAVGSGGMTETALQHNFTNQAILDAGGFSVQFRLDEINSAATDIENRYAGFGAGLSLAEAQSSGDVNGTSPPFSFRGTAANPVGTADFFLELDMAGNVKTWTNGALVATVPVAETNGVLLACFECTSFAAGAPVAVTVFLNGELVDLDPGGTNVTQTFTWDASQQDHIGLSGRASGFVTLDNLAIRTLPFSAGLATTCGASACRDPTPHRIAIPMATATPTSPNGCARAIPATRRPTTECSPSRRRQPGSFV
jgi:arylsulfatase A-like enzyme